MKLPLFHIPLPKILWLFGRRFVAGSIQLILLFQDGEWKRVALFWVPNYKIPIHQLYIELACEPYDIHIAVQIG